jgi:UDP-3-O-[3-hydroxymyristoyl] glucosamine N-acyltransferase
MPKMTAEEVRELVGGQLEGTASRVIERVSTLDRATPEELSFVATARYLPYLGATRAGVVLVRREWSAAVPDGSSAVIVDDPHAALSEVLARLYPAAEREAGIHPSAVVAADARLGEEVSIGPFAVVGEGVVIGRRSIIGSHAVVAQRCRIGEDVTIHAQATLYEGVVVGDRAVIHSGARIGKDGFGYVWKDGGHRKIPQVGGCVLEEDVEIGTNVTIDRGSVGDTIVGAGSKIDNLVHLGHNVRLGRHVILISQVGISGSTTVGDAAVLAGQVGVGGHLSIGAGARVGGQAGVTANIPPGQTYSGYPARPHREAMRAQASMFKLPELIRRLKRIEDAVFGKLEKSPEREESASAE